MKKKLLYQLAFKLSLSNIPTNRMTILLFVIALVMLISSLTSFNYYRFDFDNQMDLIVNNRTIVLYLPYSLDFVDRTNRFKQLTSVESVTHEAELQENLIKYEILISHYKQRDLVIREIMEDSADAIFYVSNEEIDLRLIKYIGMIMQGFLFIAELFGMLMTYNVVDKTLNEMKSTWGLLSVLGYSTRQIRKIAMFQLTLYILTGYVAALLIQLIIVKWTTSGLMGRNTFFIDNHLDFSRFSLDLPANLILLIGVVSFSLLMVNVRIKIAMDGIEMKKEVFF